MDGPPPPSLTSLTLRLRLLAARLQWLLVLFVAFQVDVVLLFLVLAPVPWRPRHLVLLLQPAPGVGEPGGHLRQGHLRDDGQHDLLALGGVRVLPVLVKPGLQRGRGVPCGVLPVGGVSVRVRAQRPKRVVVQGPGDARGRVITRTLKQKPSR